jgi:cyclase
MKLTQVTPRVYVNTEGLTGGNVGIILLNQQVVAVDAQYPVSGKDFRRSIQDVTDKKVSHLLLTHYHGDHVFGSQAFEDCDIVAHKLVKERMERNLKTEWASGNLERLVEEARRERPERAWLYDGLRIVLPTTVFDERYVLTDGDRIEMIHTGGHTAGSSIVYVPEDRALFAGDLLFAKTFPWAGDPSTDPDIWIDAFNTMLRLDAEVIIPGHGPVCDKSEVEFQLAFFEAVREEMQRLIAVGASAEEAAKHEGYPDFYESETPERRDDSLKHWYKFWMRQDPS